MDKVKRAIISGGGTGGHIFPAISIANALKRRFPDVKILFVGALGRMEMEKVPAAGYEIVGLPVQGFDRKRLWKNIPVLYNLCKSLWKARKIVRSFRPDVAVGVGGYASGPVLKAAAAKKVPILIQEQNSYPGVTNKLLAPKASAICVAYDGLERFFPKEKIVLTGNPVRKDLMTTVEHLDEMYRYFDLDAKKKTVLIMGGSLGARTINNAVKKGLATMADMEGVQFIWQTGKYYYEDSEKAWQELKPANVRVTAFLSRMDWAYRVADLVVSRAGAGSISELCLLGKPTILVPSPNVAEDHQTKNAMALVDKQAALLVTDAEAEEKLITVLAKVINDAEQMENLHRQILKLAKTDSDERIVDEVVKCIKDR